MSKAVESLEWVHKALVLHGDICPSNVLIVPGDPERVIMTDFDFSKTIVSQEVFDAPIGVGWGNMRLWEWENEMLGDIAGFLVCLFSFYCSFNC